MNDIKGYTYYENYYQVYKKLPDNDRLLLTDYMNQYVFENKLPTEEDSLAYSIFVNFQRALDKSIKARKYGSTGGAPTKDEIAEKQFEEFYSNYPKKRSKDLVLKWFMKNKPDKALFETIMTKLLIYKKTKQWNTDNGKFIPYPSTWLNQKRWEDEISKSDIIRTEEERLADLEKLYQQEKEYDYGT